MCGRFTVKLSPDEIGNLYDAAQPTLPLDLPPRYNGAPTQDVFQGAGIGTSRRGKWGVCGLPHVWPGEKACRRLPHIVTPLQPDAWGAAGQGPSRPTQGRQGPWESGPRVLREVSGPWRIRRRRRRRYPR